MEATNEDTEICAGLEDNESMLPADQVVIQDREPMKQQDKDEIRLKFTANDFLTPRNDQL